MEDGIAVGAYAFLDQDFSLEWSFDNKELHFEIGKDPAELQLSTTEAGLTRLIDELTEARTEFRQARNLAK